MIESYLLEYFLAVYEEGTILKASEKLSISQPSITKAIQKLEDELDLKLFDRFPNKIIINENGKIIAEYVKNIISLEERLKEKAKELKLKELTYQVALTAPGPTFKFPNCFIFNKAKHHFNLCIEEENECINDIINGTKDIAFINHPFINDKIICEKIMEEKLFASLPLNHFLSFKKDGITFNDLDGQSFLVLNDIGIWKNIIKEKLPNSRFFYQNKNELQDIIDASSIPASATNITLYMRENKNRICLPILDKEATQSFYVIYKKKNKSIIDEIKEIN